MKAIFYILSILVIGASTYFSFVNKAKLEDEMSTFKKTEGTNQNVSAAIKTTQKNLGDTTEALGGAKKVNAELSSTKENEEAKARSTMAAIEKYEAEIEDHDAKLVEFEELQKRVEDMMKGINVPVAQLPDEIEKLDNRRKALQKEFEELEITIMGLTKNVSTNREELGRQGERLVEMRQRIARNAMKGRITAVDPVWGFVVVNLGQKNSNIDAQSDLLVYRDGKFLGRLDIQSIEPTQSISDIDLKNLRPGQRICPGDTVILAKAAGS